MPTVHQNLQVFIHEILNGPAIVDMVDLPDTSNMCEPMLELILAVNWEATTLAGQGRHLADEALKTGIKRFFV